MFGTEENSHNQMIIDSTMSIVEDNDLYEFNPLIRTKSFDMGNTYSSEWEIDLEADLDNDVWRECARERILNIYIKNNSDCEIRYPNDSLMFKNNN